MTVNDATQLLTAHRNGWQVYAYDQRKEALTTLRHLVTQWIQQIDGNWHLVIIGCD